jgi:sister-chromatid-cohesion protein PDS5
MLKTEAEPAGLNGAEFKLSELSSSPKSEQSKVSPAQLSALDANNFFLSKNSQKLRSGTSNVLRENVSPEARQEMHEHKKEKSIAQPESTTKALGDSLRSPIGTSRKTLKKKSISVLQKSSEKAKKRNIDYGKLTGYRIKVWWPLDMQFYEGIVESYDSIQKKHRILYDDGDVEILKLQKERWELIDCDLITEKVSIHVEGSKSAGDKPRIKGADIGDIGILEEEKTQSSQNRRAPFKISKKSTPQSCVKPDDNGVCAKSTEVDTSRRKAQDPFVFIDDKDRKSRGKGRKQLLGSEGKKGGHFTISRKITSGTMENSKTRSSTTDEDNQGSLSDSGSRDSDDEPLNTWWSRKKNEAVKYMGQDLSLVQ